MNQETYEKNIYQELKCGNINEEEKTDGNEDEN